MTNTLQPGSQLNRSYSVSNTPSSPSPKELEIKRSTSTNASSSQTEITPLNEDPKSPLLSPLAIEKGRALSKRLLQNKEISEKSQAAIHWQNLGKKVIEEQRQQKNMRSLSRTISTFADPARLSKRDSFGSTKEVEAYAWPSFSGNVNKNSEGMLSSDDQVIDSMLQIFNKDPDFKQKIQGMTINPDQKLQFSMPEGMNTCYAQLSDSCNIQEVTIKKSASSNEFIKEKLGEDDEGISTLIPTLLRVQNAGAKAFKEQTSDVIHPYDNLAGMAPTISAGENSELAHLINEKLQAPEHKDYRARTAASFALERATKTEYALLALGLSVGLSGIAGALLEVLGGNAMLKSLFKAKLEEDGLSHSGLLKDISEEMIPTATDLQKFAMTAIRAFPMAPIELLDTLIVLSALDTIDGNKPTFKEAITRLPAAAMAGMTSFVGSLPDKAMELFLTHGAGQVAGKVIGSTATSGVSVLSCASGLFPELGSAKYHMQAALVEAHHSGTLAWPEGLDTNDPVAVEKYITGLAEGALNISPSTGIGRQSIPAALAISTAAAWASFGIPPLPMSILKIVLFNPIEAWTLNLNVMFDHMSHDKEFKKDILAIAEQAKDGKIDIVEARNRMCTAFGGMTIDGIYSGAGATKNAIRAGASGLAGLFCTTPPPDIREMLTNETVNGMANDLSELGESFRENMPAVPEAVTSWAAGWKDKITAAFTPDPEDMRLSQRIPYSDHRLPGGGSSPM